MFWIISAVFIVIALASILPALLKRNEALDATREQNITIAKEQLADLELRFEQGNINQENYQLTKNELDLSLFNDLAETGLKITTTTDNNSARAMDVLPILLLIPLIAIPLYLNLGNLNFAQQLDPKVPAQGVASTSTSMPLKPDGTPDIEKITENLKEEMESNPTDPKGWYMLGRAYMLLQRFPEAAASFDKSLSLHPNNAESLLSLADALSMDQQGLLLGRPRELVNKTLSIAPENTTALWLSGLAASQENEFVEAITQWQKVLLILDKNSDANTDEKAALANLIAEATKRLNTRQKQQITTANTRPQEKTKVKPDGGERSEGDSNSEAKNLGIKVSISLATALKDQVSPNDAVFIYAKAMNGPQMPLAAVRRQVKNLPITLTLDDDMAMIAGLKLSSFKDVVIGARVSKSGQAIPQNGDLFIEKTGIKQGDSISLELKQVFQK